MADERHVCPCKFHYVVVRQLVSMGAINLRSKSFIVSHLSFLILPNHETKFAAKFIWCILLNGRAFKNGRKKYSIFCWQSKALGDHRIYISVCLYVWTVNKCSAGWPFQAFWCFESTQITTRTCTLFTNLLHAQWCVHHHNRVVMVWGYFNEIYPYPL